MRRLTAVGAALLILAGCGKVADAEKPVPAAPAEVLHKGVPTRASGVFHYALSDGTKSAAGVVDAANQAMTMEYQERIPEGDFTVSMHSLVIGDDSWVKISFGDAPAELGLPKLPKKWMKVNPDRLDTAAAEDLTYQGETDPGWVDLLVLAATGLAETAPRHFAGTVDLTRATKAEVVDQKALTALGEKAKAVPFEATVDDQGRISTATVKVPASGKAGAFTYQVTYDQYGSADPVTPPARSAQVKAPKAAYEVLNS